VPIARLAAAHAVLNDDVAKERATQGEPVESERPRPRPATAEEEMGTPVTAQGG